MISKLEYTPVFYRFPLHFKIALIFLSAVLIFVSGHDVSHNPETVGMLNYRFHRGFINVRFFSIFELFILYICWFFIQRKHVNFGFGSLKARLILFLTFLHTVLIFVNPNNHTQGSILGMPLFTDLSYYVYLLLIYTFLFMKADIFISFIKLFVPIVFTISLLRVVLLLVLYPLGIGDYYYLHGRNSILMEEDTLLIFALLQLLLLAFIFSKVKKKGLWLFWILLLLIQILSWRRTGLLFTIITSLALTSIQYSVIIKRKEKFILYLFATIGILIFLSQTEFSFLSGNSKVFANRYFGAFFDLGAADESNSTYARNEHIDQADYGWNLAIDSGLPFWGLGYGTIGSDFNYKGNSGIHNAYVQVWLRFGLFSLFYYLFLFGIIINIASRYAKELSNYKKLPAFYLLVRGAVIIYLAMFFITAWVMIPQNFTDIRAIFVRVLLLALLLKLTPYNSLLLYQSSSPKEMK